MKIFLDSLPVTNRNWSLVDPLQKEAFGRAGDYCTFDDCLVDVGTIPVLVAAIIGELLICRSR